MTYEQYWEQDSWLVKAYRKAQEIRRDEANFRAWLQGMYVYEAIADIAPILHAFAKKGTKARKYAEKPYEFKKPERGTTGKTDPEKRKADMIKARMLAAMQEHNKALAKKRIDELKETFMGVQREPVIGNTPFGTAKQDETDVTAPREPRRI